MAKKNCNKIGGYVHPFRVHVPLLLNETFVCAIRPTDLNALRVPINQLLAYLRSVTQRCAEINDPVLNKLMIDMTLYEQSDVTSEEYSQEMVDKVNENYINFLNQNQ